uniref:Phosphatidylinositol N-acetylglucosaminyltransferase subunit Y n=1 Tax=Kalanchoe fedtschenkoi TaxID=63787 RepID=A0A7N0RIH6_KALFE
MSASKSMSISSAQNVALGLILVGFGILFLLGFIYAAIISKLLPPSDNVIISAIQNDWYYCFLVPLTLPILVVAVYFHWLSMKLFKHA